MSFIEIFQQLLNKEVKLSIIGVGYVGLPLTVAFAKHLDVIAFDKNKEKIHLYKQGIDVTNEVGNKALKKASVEFTNDEAKLKNSRFHIIAVPTPINKDKTPNLKPVINASEIVGRNLIKDSIIVYESTVYPGVTEEICIPILEKESGLKCGEDFKVGYSPERINPGDQVHRLENIIKVVSGMDDEALEIIYKVYDTIIDAGLYRAESIKVAEAAKVIENSQRDINIAFMNELSIIFNKLEIDTLSVLKAARTKWNFLDFTPGLVGGHCIGIDPYYLTYKAEETGYHSQIILAGRKINDYMGKYIAENTVKYLIKADITIKGAKVAIMGITFKENCPDVRNTKVIDIINELYEFGIQVYVTDPIANEMDVYQQYSIRLTTLDKLNDMDAIIMAVKHDVFKDIKLEHLRKKYGVIKPVLIDVKGMFDRALAEREGFYYWRL